MNRLFIGIEGGATKTEGVLIDETGHIHVTAHAGPSNPWVSRSIDQQCDEIRYVVNRSLALKMSRSC